MAFHIQHPERRNLLLEGILQGSNRGQEEASKIRLMQQQQQQKQQQVQQSLSAISPILNQMQGPSFGPEPQQGSEAGQYYQQQQMQEQAATDTLQNPLKFASLISLLPDKDTRDKLWDGYKTMLDKQKISPSETSKAVLDYFGVDAQDLGRVAEGNPERFQNIQDALEYVEKNSKGNPYGTVADFMRKKESRLIKENTIEPESKTKPKPVDKVRTVSEIKTEEKVNEFSAIENIKLESEQKKSAANYVSELTQKAIKASNLNQSITDLNKVADIMSKKGQGTLGTTTRASLAKKYPSFENFFLTNEQIQNRVLAKPLAELGKDLFPKLSEREFFEVIRPMMVTEADSPEVIRQKTKSLSKLAENMLIAPSIADLLIQKNDGKIPADIDRQILKQMIKASQKNLKIKV